MAAKDFIPNIIPDAAAPTPRQSINLLPGYLQTSALSTFLGITLDQLIQPAQQENVSGYIGEKGGLYYNPSEDFYLNEITNSRNDYQLEPTAVSVDNNNNTNFVEFYQDMINSLEFDGALVNNHSRLFAEEYYSWAPPINPDMFVNFTNYFWVQIGPAVNVITDATNAVLDIIGQSAYTTPSGLVLQSGMKIQLTNDANTEFNGINYIVEGVGATISLIDDTAYDNTDRYDIPGYDTTPYDGFAATTNPDYWTIRRDSQDGNPWSRTNRWFNKDVLGNLNLGETTLIQASRPIIEFLPNIELRNFARYSRPDVKLLSTTDSILDIIGQTSYTIDGLTLLDDYRILITGDPDSTKNNRIYKVFGLEKYGRIGLSLELDGLDPTGAPVLGEGVKILSGIVNSNTFVYYNGTTWVEGQQKLVDNQAPIYNLYDLNAVRLDSLTEYPGSNFNGSQIFSYTPSGTTIDPVLGIDLTFDTYGDIGFTDFLTTTQFTYLNNRVSTPITGYYFYRQFTTPGDTGADLYENDWHKSSTESRQLVKDEFVITPLLDNLNEVEYELYYQLSIAPDANAANLPVNRRAYLNGMILVENVDYDITGSTLRLSDNLALATNDVLEVETWAQTIPELLSNGYFEIPTNLSGNPNNEQITQRSYNEIAPQLISIIQNQTNLIGSPNGENNFLNTSRDLSRGQLLLNHAASLLRVALLTGNPNTKLTDSMRYSNLQYTTFKNKFLIKLQQFINQGLTSQDSTTVWINEALTQINLGKTSTFPFAFSAMTNGNNYIPSTPSSLGVTPTYLPSIYLDTTKVTPTMVIQGHDGSLYNAYGDYRDQVILALETNIYNNIDPNYNAVERVLEFDQNSIIPGYFRSTDYSRDEFLQILQPGFERWVVRERLDYVQNSTYDSANIFTWNFSKVHLPNGDLAPGHWRGIFLYFYDTYRPHTNPWEMLGFSQEPTWWSSQYGDAPYTRENSFMWTDLENGVIRQGPRAGTYTQYARPNLSNLIPVDGQGNLLDPVTIGLVTSSPNEVDAQANWEFGDSGPVEFLWRISSSYPYDLAEALFLAKPARFVDTFWEARKIARDQGQIYDIDLGRRFTSADLTVHNEILTSGARAVVKGISNWVSDYLANLNLDIATNFGDLERFLNAKLAYKAGSFIKQDTLRLNSDSFGLVPSENITTKLYKSASISQPIYSAVIVIYDGTTYRVSGYDSIGQKFTILPGIETGNKAQVTVGNTTVTQLSQNTGVEQDIVYYTSLPSRQAVYNFFVGYQAWLESQGWAFGDYDTINGTPKDFITAASNFLEWSNVPLTPGQAIIFSPLSDHLVFNVSHGHVENIGQFVNGVYGVLDRTGYGINTQQFNVSRNTGSFEVTLKDTSVQGIYCLRLSLVEYEHIIILDNTTDFGNLIYDPVLGIRQPRFQLFANRTMYWTGEPTAAGFIVQDNDLIDNFETSVDNFRNFYDFDLNPATGIQGELAQHTIGYQERDYLANLLLDTNTEFDYYKGFIGSKGTLPSFSNILRSNYITKTAGFSVLEEWAFLIGEYGNTERKSAFELQVKQSDFTTDPQLIEFVNTQGSNPSYIDIVPTDSRWVLKNKNNNTNNQFNVRDFTNKYRKDLPTAGYVQVGETTYTALNTSALTDLFNTVIFTNTSRFNDGDTIWQIILDNGGWNVYRVCQDVQLASVEIGVNPSDPTVFTAVGNGPLDLNAGDILFLQDSTQTSGELQGVQNVLNTQTTSPALAANQFSISTSIDTGIVYPTQATGTVENPVFAQNDTIGITVGTNAEIIVSISASGGVTQAVNDITAALQAAGLTTTTASATQSNQLQISDSAALPIVIDTTTQGAIDAGLPATSSLTGPYVYVLKSVRFANATAVTNFTPYNGWLSGDKVFVDNNGINLWEVLSYVSGMWAVSRTQTDKIDIDQIYNSFIYDSITNQDVIQVQLYDPCKGLIFAAADTQLSYKLDFDPAKYNNGDATVYQIIPELAWGDNQVGQLWWDLSTTRFLDYEQGSLDYKRKNWGSVAPGVVVNIYEWVKSPVPPSGWNAYVFGQNDAGDNRPTGTPIYDSTGADTPYVTTVTYDPSMNSDVTNYYFWVLNPNTIPEGIPSRTLPASEVQALIQNTTGQSIVWMAPIAPSAFIINNADNFINDQSSVLQVTFFEDEVDSIIHKQWILLRELDEINPPYSAVWNKMRDSLVGFDDMNLTVPDPALSPVVMFGNAFRPRQTWFEDRIEARLEFFAKVNLILAANNVVSISGYADGLNASDPLPPVTAYDYQVATRAARDALDNKIPIGSTVLVDSDEDLNGYWTLWTYNGLASWTLNSQESYRATDYFEYIDWYATGFSSATIPNYTYRDISTMNANASSFATGDIILVENNGTGNFSLYQYILSNTLSEFNVVGEQNGTIQFLPTLWNYATTTTAYDPTNAADVAASTVTKSFIAALQENLLTILEQNSVFFTMVQYAHFEQTIVPWAFKASTLYGQGQLIPFRNDYILPADETDDLVSFFQEAKPYHVKLRTLTEQRRTQVDEADVHVTDSNVFTINLIFDRVTLTAAPAGQTPTAVDRIIEYYAPTEGMPPKVLAALINRGEFGGTILDGKSFYQFGTLLSSGYDNQPYDDTYLGGYDFSDANIVGTVQNPTTNVGDTFIVNGVLIPMTGTTLSSAIDDINLTSYILGNRIDLVTGANNAINPAFNVGDIFVINGQTVTLFPTSITGTIDSPSNLQTNDIITINGQTVVMTGSTIAQAVIDIDTALIPNIIATESNNALVITASTGTITQLDGNMVQKCGLTVSLAQAIELINSNVGLQAANIIAVNNGNGQLEIYNSPSGTPTQPGIAITASGIASTKAGLPNTSITLNNVGIFASAISQGTTTITQSMQITDKGNVDLNFGGVAVTDFGFAALVENGSLTPSTIENFYDVFVNGGNPLNQSPNFAEPTQTDSTINVDGNQLIQPYLDANHPEELVSSRVGDAVIIDVYTYDTQLGGLGYDSSGYDTGGYDMDSSDTPGQGLRFPKHRVKRYFGTPAGILGPFTIGQLPQNKQALFVHKNGVLLKLNNEYTVDWDASTVTLVSPIFPTDILVISSFGVGGGFIVKKKVVNNTSATTFDMKTPIASAEDVYAMVDGNIATVTTSGTIVTITDPLPNNSTVLIVVFNNSTFSTVLTETQVVLPSSNIPYQFNVTRPADSTVPKYLTTDVYLNEKRLSPPPMAIYTQDNVTVNFNLPITALDTADINVWADDVLLTQGIDYTATTTNITMLGTPLSGTILAVQVNEDSDYSIAGNEQVTINVPVAVNDILQVTTYSEDSSFQMFTESFPGNAQNQFGLGIKPYDTDSLIVYLNGLLLTFGKDYKLVDPTVSYDSEKDDSRSDGFISATSAITVELMGIQTTPNDKFVATYFTQYPSQDPIAFRMYKNIFGNYQYLRISDANSTVTTAPLLSTDKVVVVEDATVLGTPNIASQTPGVVFINGERITYWSVDTTTPGAHQLLQCMRGTQGTGINIDLDAGAVVRDASLNQEIPGNSFDWNVNPEGLQYSNDPQALFLQQSPGTPDFGS